MSEIYINRSMILSKPKKPVNVVFSTSMTLTIDLHNELKFSLIYHKGDVIDCNDVTMFMLNNEKEGNKLNCRYTGKFDKSVKTKLSVQSSTLSSICKQNHSFQNYVQQYALTMLNAYLCYLRAEKNLLYEIVNLNIILKQSTLPVMNMKSDFDSRTDVSCECYSSDFMESYAVRINPIVYTINPEILPEPLAPIMKEKEKADLLLIENEGLLPINMSEFLNILESDKRKEYYTFMKDVMKDFANSMYRVINEYTENEEHYFYYANLYKDFRKLTTE